MHRFETLVTASAREMISDLHIMSGMPLVYRKNGELMRDSAAVWNHDSVSKLIGSLMNARDREVFESRMSVDFARTVKNVRIRINVFSSMNGYGLAVRLLPAHAPTIEMLNLHPDLKAYCRIRDGLILICGSTGAGKSGTIAAMIEEINRTTASRIITLEDPIEYRFASRKSIITQRELGTHFPSFKRGLLDVLREDADVIVVGELRDPETMRLALDAAESGHVVITTAHASGSEDALHRICNSFSADAQAMVRNQLASTLSLLVVQKLVMHRRNNYRIPVMSILRGTQSVKAMIRDDRLVQLESAIQTGKQFGMYTMDQYEEVIYSSLDLRPPSMSYEPPAEQGALPPEPVPSFHIRVKPSEEASEAVPQRQEGARIGKTSGVPGQESGYPGNQYVIEETVTMEELINEMNRLPKK